MVDRKERSANALTNRVRLQRREDDENGDPLGPWEDVATRRAEIVYLRGGETVMAQRLQGIQPAVVAVYADRITRAATNAWRLVDDRTGQVHEITAPPTVTANRRWVEILTTAKSGERVNG